MMVDLAFCGYDLSVWKLYPFSWPSNSVSQDNVKLLRLKSRLPSAKWLIAEIQLRSGWMEKRRKNPH